MKNSKRIPKKVKEQVEQIVKEFNKNEINDPECYYTTRYRGLYLYLDRYDNGRVGPICRLQYTEDVDNWDFAIYKYSSERYDPEEWFFPGAEFVDGTIRGAMLAGLEAYP